MNTGLYNNASEVIRDALRLKMQHEEIYQTKLEALRSAINEGNESGDPILFDINEMISEAKHEMDVNA